MGSENVRCIRMKICLLWIQSLSPVVYRNPSHLNMKKKFTYLDTTGANLNAVTSRLQIPDKINAPVKKGDTVGQRIYYLDEKSAV